MQMRLVREEGGGVGGLVGIISKQQYAGGGWLVLLS